MCNKKGIGEKSDLIRRGRVSPLEDGFDCDTPLRISG